MRMHRLIPVGVCTLLLWHNLALAQKPEQPWFRDATKEYGSIGGGPPALVDLDGDGWPDLICDGRIYKNDGGKRFIDVTKDTGVSGTGSAVVADVDNDGLPDIYFCGGTGALFHNLGKMKFEDWTKKIPPNKHRQSLAAAFGDVDGDGNVDLYVSNYEDWRNDNTYPHPHLLFRNRGGDKGFEPWWESKDDKVLPGRGVTFLDVDGDGLPEIYVSNYRLAPNFLWAFDKKTILKDRGMELGVAGTPGPKTRYGTGLTIRCCGHTIGSCVGDFDNDTHLDILVANFSHPPVWQNRVQFLRNGGPPSFKFEDKSAIANLRWQESYAVAVAGDVDNDGRVDFFLTTVYPGDKSVMYRNLGDWKFEDVTAKAGVLTDKTYQAAFADINGDGFLDMVSGGKVWINTLGEHPTMGKHRWLKVRLEGSGKCNRQAIGSRVIVKVGDRTFTRQVEAGTGSGCQNDLTLHFGVGTATGPAEVIVHWAGGGKSTHRAELNQTTVLRRK